MKRRSISLLLAITMLLGATVFSFASPAAEIIKPISEEKVLEIADTVDVSKGFVNKPRDFVLATVNDAVIVSGAGKENDCVSITMYRRSGKEFVAMGEKVELKIGPLGVFTKELSLKLEGKSPKESAISKETFLVLELKRGNAITWDYRLIRYSDDKDVKKSLDSLNTAGIGSVK